MGAIMVVFAICASEDKDGVAAQGLDQIVHPAGGHAVD
jgi:hypothetical protein